MSALAARDASGVTVLVGGGRSALAVEVRGLVREADVRVRVDRVGWSGYEGALDGTRRIVDRVQTTEAGSVLVEVPNDDPLAAYRVTLSPEAFDRSETRSARAHTEAAPIMVAAHLAEVTDVTWVDYDQDWQQYAGTGRRGIGSMPRPTSRATFTVDIPSTGEWQVALLYGTDGIAAVTGFSVDGDPRSS